MGSSASKVAGQAAGAAGRRQYPSTSSIVNSATTTSRSHAPTQSITPGAPSQVHPNLATNPPSDDKSAHIELDGRDPQFGSALRKIGVAKPVSETKPHEDAFPTSSQPMNSGQNIFPSNKDNPAILLVQSRQRIGHLFEAEVENRGRATFPGRTLLSAKEIKEALTLRDESGKTSQQIEKAFNIKPGILDQLASRGSVANA